MELGKLHNSQHVGSLSDALCGEVTKHVIVTYQWEAGDSFYLSVPLMVDFEAKWSWGINR